MTYEDTTQRANRLLPLIAVTIAAFVFAVWGRDRGIAAFVGGALSVLNWASLRWLTRRIMRGKPSQRAAISMLLFLKMGALMAIIFVLIHKLVLDPIGLTLGLATLFIAPLLSAALGMGTSPESHAATAASEER